LQGVKSALEKGQTKILEPAGVIWDQISEIWLQKGQPGIPGVGFADCREGAICKVRFSTCNYIILEQKWELWWGSSCWDDVAIRQVFAQAPSAYIRKRWSTRCR